MEMLILGLSVLGGLVGLFTVKTILSLRRVVATNEVHIVQSGKATLSFGKDTGNGNSYYEWPSWLPIVGVTKVVLPVSNFDVDLVHYEANDQGRLPFLVTVKGFFRIKDSNIAAQRVASFKELQEQLQAITQGAIRTVLASASIEEIMQGRSTFGDKFTQEVNENLGNWGVETVRNIELMDIKDSQGSGIIESITNKKKSQIQMESRTEVARNMKTAEVAELEARREVELQKQEVAQTVGLRTVEAQRQVELQQQAKSQAVKEAEKLTKEKEMAVTEMQNVRTAEITQKTTLINAEQERKTAIIKAEAQRDTVKLNAEAEKNRTTLIAEGQLEAKRREAEGISLEGIARADAEKAIQLAPVQAQITLAKEIGENASYQNYLITIRKIEAGQAVGMEQAKALSAADIKVISNTGSPTSGLNSVMDLFSSQGGTQVGAMLEGLVASDVGQALVEKVVGTKPKAPVVTTTKTPSLVNGKAN